MKKTVKTKGIRLLVLMTALAMLFSLFSLPAGATGYALPEGTVIHGESALLMNLGGNASADVVLFDKNADEVHAPGAMMRFMVVAYALHRAEEKGLDVDTATGTYTLEMFNHYVAGTGVPTANMAYGETWTVRDLITASFIQNASDAVTTLAFAVDDGVSAFVQGMNDLADEIGCDYTHYSNITGLDSLGQYTTARDMYRIIRYAQTFSVFESLVSPRQVTVTPVSGGSPHTLVSVNNMQQSSSTFYYSPMVYGRTGLSEREGRTFAAVARDSGYEYLAVVFACPETDAEGNHGMHFTDVRNLFRWGFKNFSYTTLLTKSELLASVKVKLSWSTDRVNLMPEDSFSTVVKNGLSPDEVIKKVTVYEESVSAPVEKGDILGKVELIVNVDQKIGEINLVASESISRNWLLFAWSGIGAFLSSVWFWLGLLLLLLLLGGYVLLNIVYNRRRRQNRLDRVKTPRR